MSEKEWNILKNEYMIASSKYRRKFKLFFRCPYDVLQDAEKFKNCIELLKRSCTDGVDYVSKQFGIDVKHMQKKTTVLYD